MWILARGIRSPSRRRGLWCRVFHCQWRREKWMCITVWKTTPNSHQFSLKNTEPSLESWKSSSKATDQSIVSASSISSTRMTKGSLLLLRVMLVYSNKDLWVIEGQRLMKSAIDTKPANFKTIRRQKKRCLTTIYQLPTSPNFLRVVRAWSQSSNWRMQTVNVYSQTVRWLWTEAITTSPWIQFPMAVLATPS